MLDHIKHLTSTTINITNKPQTILKPFKIT